MANEGVMAEVLSMHIDELGLTVRSYNCLRRQEIRRVGDLVRQTPQQLLNIRNMGQTSLQDVERALGRMGLRLGMQNADTGRTPRIADATKVREAQAFVGALEFFQLYGVDRVETLVYMTRDDLLRIPGVDGTILEAIENGLQKWGLQSGLRRPAQITGCDATTVSVEK
ncbi:MAG: hypothetical protein F4034_10225, partial [Chloroflexi bacterium]|nr:hypothetical protein [Chloroflexota bacterium]